MGIWIRVAVTFVALAVALLAAACTAGSAPQAVVALTVSDGVMSPGEVTVAPGQPVQLTLDNQDTVPHQVAIDDIALATSGGSGAMAGMDHDMMDEAMTAMPAVHMMAAPGTREMVEFTPTQEGTYEIRCLEPGHTELGVLRVQKQP